VRSEAERARIVAESLLPGAQVSEVARKHGATRWQIYDWRSLNRRLGRIPDLPWLIRSMGWEHLSAASSNSNSVSQITAPSPSRASRKSETFNVRGDRPPRTHIACGAQKRRDRERDIDARASLNTGSEVGTRGVSAGPKPRA
jgi:transposase-like protein